jgi:hypothetical protein
MPKGQRDVRAHRGEDMHPLLIRPVGVPPGTPAGFELVCPDEIGLAAALTTKQMEHWQKLPAEFRFNDVADALESECGRLSGGATLRPCSLAGRPDALAQVTDAQYQAIDAGQHEERANPDVNLHIGMMRPAEPSRYVKQNRYQHVYHW